MAILGLLNPVQCYVAASPSNAAPKLVSFFSANSASLSRKLFPSDSRSSTISDSGAVVGHLRNRDFAETSKMLSFTRRNGSRIEQVVACSHSPCVVTQEVMDSGPSIALITSKR